MSSARFVFYVAVIFAGYLSVNAVPVDPKDVQAGQVFWAEPQHFDPPSYGSRQGRKVAHPVVSTSNAEGDYVHVVATTSSSFPVDMKDRVVPATGYTRHTDKKFKPHTDMAVGNPVHVHVNNLQPVGTDAQMPHQLHRTDTEALMRGVYRHYYPLLVAQQSPYNAYRAGHDAAAQAGYHPPHNQQHPAPHPQRQFPPHPQSQFPPHPQGQFPPHPQGQFPPHPQGQSPQHPQGQYPPHGAYPPHPPHGWPH